MKQISLNLVLIIAILFVNVALAEFPQTSGFFVISGYTNSRLLWKPINQEPQVDLGSLGVVANRVIWNGQYLVVVNSGNFAGFSSELWYVNNTQVTQAINQQIPLQWSVISFPQFSNLYDAVIFGNHAFVSALGTSQIFEVDFTTNTIVRVHSTVANPQDLLLTNDYLYVAGSGFGTGNTVARHNRVTFYYDSVQVGYNPQGLKSLSDGSILVACAGASWSNPPYPGSVAVILPTQQVLHSTPSYSFSPTNIALTTDQRILAGGEYGTPNVAQITISNQSIQYSPISHVSGGWQIIPDTQGSVWITSTTTNTITKYDHNWNALQTITFNQVPAYVAFHHPALLSVERETTIQPNTIQLSNCYPNPFNQTLKIPFVLSKESNITVKVFNILGEQVDMFKTIRLNVGNHQIQWSPQRLSSGKYILQIETAEHIQRTSVQYLK
ncbi:MAG: T9SS type A sorting domain-containing protein [bacterium]|nr:T9SS type A sorting domain-containing protein [bacterium]